MNEIIEHKAIIKESKENKLLVQVQVDNASCQSCKVKNTCAVGKLNTKLIEVENDKKLFLTPNDEIKIYYDEKLGLKAVFIAYLMPFIVLIVSLFVFIYAFKLSEGLSGLLSLGVMVLYYLSLLLFKKRLTQEFSFKIKTKT